MDNFQPLEVVDRGRQEPCPNFEINTEFDRLVYGVITTNILHVLMVFLGSILFVYEILRLFAMRLENSDGIRLIIA